MRRRAIRAVVVLAAVYLLLCALTPFVGSAVVFPAPSSAPTPVADAQEVTGPTEDGKVARALLFAPRQPTRKTLVFFHGNGELADHEAGFARTMVEQGYRVALAEYRGYGLSRAAGPPSERGLYADADAILRAVDADSASTVVVGFSLGTGVAMEMAARGRARAVVLFAPYTSVPDVAARRVPFLPVHRLMRESFDSLAKAPGIDVPTLVVHGDVDGVIPFDMGETVAHALPHGRFLPVPGEGHVDIVVDPRVLEKVAGFLLEVMPL